MTRPQLKERRWEIMEVGEEFGPSFVTVNDRLVRDFAYSVDDFNPQFLYPSPGGVHFGHPTLLCREARDIIGTVYDIASGGAGMHAKHECELHSCPKVGETYSITGRHIEKYLKREKQYIVLESEVRGASGELVLKQRSTHIRALKPGVAKAPSQAVADEPKGVAPPVYVQDLKDLEPGMMLRSLKKVFAQEHLTVFAGTSWPNIHNDPSIARSAGLRGTVVSGLQTMAAVSELMDGYGGEGWRNGGSLAVAFTAPAFVDETIEIGGAIKDVGESDGRRWFLADVWCDSQTGARVLAGTARAWIPAAQD